MERIGIDEVHNCVLAIAKEFDRICEVQGIPYYMLGGTMLGAIRHKGFIPWDDDMDFGVPIQYFPILIKALNEQLKQPYRCCTYENSSSVYFPFIKIEHTGTVLDDPQIPLPIEKKIGLNIDIFPLISCDLNDKSIPAIWKLAKIYGIIFTDSRQHGGWVNFVKRTLRMLLPWSEKDLYYKIKERLLNLKDGSYLGNILGRWREREIIPIEWYGDKERYVFEDTFFYGIKEYDLYLNQLYGDYMELPPEDQRTGDHANNVYLR